ncbi:hypothetical protein [Aeromonas sp. HMWF016]|uniref:hypothetical protein n=1 Tax=Aeromonas sp. HMWF016 TaxID=2056852 RepID=UPI0011B1E89C|nr:hypothetical protein [Aeromonas sp. HMWF016]
MMLNISKLPVAGVTFVSAIIVAASAESATSNISSVIYGHAPIGLLRIDKKTAPGGKVGKLQPGATLLATPSLTDEDGDLPAPYVVQYQWVKATGDISVIEVIDNAWQQLDISAPLPITVENIGFHIIIKFVPTTLTGLPNTGVTKYWSSARRVIDGNNTVDIDDPTGPVESISVSEGAFSVALVHVSGETFTDVGRKSPGIYPKEGSDLNPIVGSIWKASITCDANIQPLACKPDNFTYQWKIVTDVGAIDATGVGANTESYTVNAFDQGKKIFVEVFPKSKSINNGD